MMTDQKKSEYPTFVHKNLARFIRMRGVSLSHLGRAVGCSGENIGQKLRGERKLFIDDLLKWCRFLDVTPAAAFVAFEDGFEEVPDTEVEAYVGFLTWLGKRSVSYRIELFKFAKYLESYNEPVSPGPFVALPSGKKVKSNRSKASVSKVSLFRNRGN